MLLPHLGIAEVPAHIPHDAELRDSACTSRSSPSSLRCSSAGTARCGSEGSRRPRILPTGACTCPRSAAGCALFRFALDSCRVRRCICASPGMLNTPKARASKPAATHFVFRSIPDINRFLCFIAPRFSVPPRSGRRPAPAPSLIRTSGDPGTGHLSAERQALRFDGLSPLSTRHPRPFCPHAV